MRRISLVLATLVIAVAAPSQGFADARMPVVVELFTSQGCSSCPPANANLVTLSQRTDVLVLSFAVTYWDRLGWKDTFGKPEFTERQISYEPALDQFGPYTPQMVVNGSSTAVGNRLEEVEALIDQAVPLPGPSLDLGTAMLSIAAGTAPNDGVNVWRVTYDPHKVDVPVARGENNGRNLIHTHVVHSLENIGTWTGSALDLQVSPAGPGLKTAILVQAKNGGPILSAVTD